jgi:hypothetical protein
VNTKGRRNDIVGAVKPFDLHCGGVVSVAAALVVLKYAGEGKCTGLPGCTPPEARSTALCGSTSTQTASLTLATRSDMLLDAAGLT